MVEWGQDRPDLQPQKDMSLDVRHRQCPFLALRMRVVRAFGVSGLLANRARDRAFRFQAYISPLVSPLRLLTCPQEPKSVST